MLSSDIRVITSFIYKILNINIFVISQIKLNLNKEFIVKVFIIIFLNTFFNH